MNIFKRNPFGHNLLIKKWLIRILGFLSHQRFNRFNKLKIEGSEVIKSLPENNVLFVSNHQTYFADVFAMFHVFNASLSGREDSIKNVMYLWQPKLNIYFIAAKETMKDGIFPRILAYVGSVSIDRTWRSKGEEVNRQVKMSDISKIGTALNDGWVITFPQGTTTPFKPIRRGTAHIIKNNSPLIVPIKLLGFNDVFQRNGLKILNRKKIFSMEICKPIRKNIHENSIDEITSELEKTIN